MNESQTEEAEQPRVELPPVGQIMGGRCEEPDEEGDNDSLLPTSCDASQLAAERVEIVMEPSWASSSEQPRVTQAADVSIEVTSQDHTGTAREDRHPAQTVQAHDFGPANLLIEEVLGDGDRASSTVPRDVEVAGTTLGGSNACKRR